MDEKNTILFAAEKSSSKQLVFSTFHPKAWNWCTRGINPDTMMMDVGDLKWAKSTSKNTALANGADLVGVTDTAKLSDQSLEIDPLWN